MYKQILLLVALIASVAAFAPQNVGFRDTNTWVCYAFHVVDDRILSFSFCNFFEPILLQSSVCASPSTSMTRLPAGPRPSAPESLVLLTSTEPQQFTRSTLSKSLPNTRYLTNLLPHYPSQRNKQRVAAYQSSWYDLESNFGVKMLKINRIRRQWIEILTAVFYEKNTRNRISFGFNLVVPSLLQ